MSTITEFSIGCSKLIALPGYQNIRVEASITVSMDPNESLADASGIAQQQLRQLLEETYKAQYKHAVQALI